MRNALIQIEDRMVHSMWMPDVIMGVNRGGVIPGVYLSHRIKKPHEVLDVQNFSASDTVKFATRRNAPGDSAPAEHVIGTVAMAPRGAATSVGGGPV